MDARILVTLDGSALAEAVVPHVMRLARAAEYGVTLLHVVTPGERSQNDLWVAAAPADMRRQWETDALTAIHTYLAAIAGRMRVEGIEVHTEVVSANQAAEAILEYATRDPSITLIAMSTRGRSGLQRLVLGSVAMAVLQMAPLPVLLVRAE